MRAAAGGAYFRPWRKNKGGAEDKGRALDPGQLRADQSTVESGFWSKVKKTIGNVPLIEDAIASFYAATDSATPIHVKAVLFGALAYFVLPLDAIPDFIPGVGFTDDAAVLAAALATVRRHVTQEHRRRAREFLEIELGTGKDGSA